MNTLIKLAPLAVGLVIFAAIVAVLVQKNMAVGTWLIAAFLLGHGLVHVMFAVAPPNASTDPAAAEFAFDANRSWLVTDRLVDARALRLIVLALIAVTIGGYTLAALSTLGFVIPTTLWPALVIAATTASAALMVIGLTPALVLGIAIDLVLFVVVITSAWLPGRVIPA
jgi:hypothetical protein